ncbi:MAG: GGDEF domain-containing protein [Lachnospiraceae bacterium]|nr:GGDEF domain-containing protein [Lachnospiraceae bacterium]
MNEYLANATLCALGILLDFIVFFNLKTYRKDLFTEDRCLHIFIIANAYVCISDFFAALLRLYPSPSNYWLVMTNYTLNYTALTLSAYMWLVYSILRTWPERRIHSWQVFLSSLPVTVVFLLCLSSHWTHWIIRVNQLGVYSRGHYYYIPWLIDPLLIITGFLLPFLKKEKGKRYRFFPFKRMFFVVFLGALFQNITGNLCTIGVSISVALVILTLCLKDEQVYIDTLTGVYNRQYMMNYLRSMTEHNKLSKIYASGKVLAGIELDLDHFKEINDQYGHAMGDAALQQFGSILREVAGQDGIPVRTGGDEFMLLFHSYTPGEVDQHIQLIRTKLQEFNEKHTTPYQLQSSCGVAYYTNEHDQVEQDIDALLQRMDHAIYQEKVRHHASLNSTPRNSIN